MMKVVVVLLCLAAHVFAQGGFGITPPAPYLTLYGPPYTSSGSVGRDPTPVNVGLRFTTQVLGQISGVFVYRIQCNTYTNATLYNSAGTKLATAILPPPPADCSQWGGQWTYVFFGQNISVTPGQNYTVSVYAPSGQYAYDAYGFQQARLRNYIQVELGGGVFLEGSAPAFPYLNYLKTEYYVSPIFLPDNTVTTTPAPTLPPVLPEGETLYPNPTPGASYPDSNARTTNIGVKFTVDVSGTVTGCIVYTQQCNQYRNCTLFSATGAVLATAPISGASGDCLNLRGFVGGIFETPYTVVAGTTYTVGALAFGYYPYITGGFNSTRTISLGHITVPVGGGVYNWSSETQFPTITESTNREYLISPVFKPTPGVTPKPTVKPTPSPTPKPTPSPTPKPTPSPTPSPTPYPTQSLYYPYSLSPSIASDTGSVTVGVQFNVGYLNGEFLGVYAYTNDGGCGHTWALYDFTGNSVAAGSLPCPSTAAPGWVSATLATPYWMTSTNRNYTVGVFFPNGRYAFTSNGFASGRTVGNIVVPASGGLFNYGPTITRPTSSFQSSEYYITPLIRQKLN